MRAGVICLALAIGGGAAGAFAAAADRKVDAASDSAAVADIDSVAVAGADSVAVSGADSGAVAGADSGAVAAADTATVAGLDRAAVVGVDAKLERPPWTALVAPGDTLVLSRNEVERTGAHFPLDLLAFIPGAHALSASGTVPFGAVTMSGSFAIPELTSDGWPIRLPRLEGRDLSRRLLDRLGPGPTLVPLAAPGELQIVDRGGLGTTPAVRWTPSEPVADSAQSRIAVYHGGFGLTGGGLVFSDRRGSMQYGFGFDNTGAKRSGSIDGTSTRLAMIDAGGVTSWGRITASLRGTEADIDWKNGRQLKHDDQGAAVEAVLDRVLGPAWSLRFEVLDDRLNGNEFPGREFKRKGAHLQTRWWAGRSPVAWFGLAGERDRFKVRGPGSVLAPLVLRGRVEAGARLGGTPGKEGGGSHQLHLGFALRASDRHSPRSGGQVELQMKLPQSLRLGVGASREHRAPTFDQEVLVRGRPAAEPERHDAATLQLDMLGQPGSAARPARPGLGILVARRRLAHQPVVIKESATGPWPEFDFATHATEHWEMRAMLSTPPGPFGFEAGAWGSRFDVVGGALPTLMPKAVGRAYVTLRFDLLGGDLILRPRMDGLLVGSSHDFAGERVAGHARLDATVVAIVGENVDLELQVRNALDHRYRLAVLDPTSNQLDLDSGRVTTVGLRWRLAN